MPIPTAPQDARGPGRWRAWALGAAALAGGGLLWRVAAGPISSGDPTGPWAWLPMLSFGAASGLAGVAWGRLRLERALREERQARQGLEQLIDTWYWETDAEHRLLSWRPPADAPAADWSPTADQGQRLWQRFELDGATAGALKARLDNPGGPMELRVLRQGSARPEAWSLRAVPRQDADGRFLGHVGTARCLAEDEARHTDQAALAALLPGLGEAVVLLERQGDGWALRAASPPALASLGLERLDTGLDWASLQAQLPSELATALAALEPGREVEAGDWRLTLQPVADGRCRLLRWQGLSTPGETQVSAAEHESFTYSVSHDLRAPIRVVDGFARILKEDYGRFLDRIGNDHLDRVLAAASRMNSMIDALLALSRLQSQPLQRRPVDLSQLATYIVDDLRRESPERAAEVQIEPGIVVEGDPTLLRIAMDNLIGNAWKYSSQCALTHIGFRRELQDGRPVMVVSDQGAGFDMRFADRLFGVFQRLHSPKDFQGTGVGLASVRRILRRHGGDIWAESEVGKGARFYFTIDG